MFGLCNVRPVQKDVFFLAHVSSPCHRERRGPGSHSGLIEAAIGDWWACTTRTGQENCPWRFSPFCNARGGKIWYFSSSNHSLALSQLLFSSLLILSIRFIWGSSCRMKEKNNCSSSWHLLTVSTAEMMMPTTISIPIHPAPVSLLRSLTLQTSDFLESCTVILDRLVQVLFPARLLAHLNLLLWGLSLRILYLSTDESRWRVERCCCQLGDPQVMLRLQPAPTTGSRTLSSHPKLSGERLLKHLHLKIHEQVACTRTRPHLFPIHPPCTI